MRARALAALLLLGGTVAAQSGTVRLESRWMAVEVDGRTGRWALVDKRSGVRWPTKGTASAGSARGLRGGFAEVDTSGRSAVRVVKRNGAAVVFELVGRPVGRPNEGGRTLEIRYEGEAVGDVRVLGDALAITDVEGGYALVPCREGLLVRADSGKSFRRTFGTSDYEGCHMNMLSFVKAGSALVVSWDDAYVFPELRSERPRNEAYGQRLTATFSLRGSTVLSSPQGGSARSVRLTPLGEGDWNTVAAGYRRLVSRVHEAKGALVTLREKIRRNTHCERMVGAANVKLWTCLARRMNEESTEEESVKVRWTFSEAADIAEHLHNDLGVERCLFIIGGWTEGGYDCRHPDNLPANPECGGNSSLAEAVERIQALGYVVSLHDNVQDMYRDAKSWDPAFIEKRPDGTLVKGGRWLGGRAYMVCAPKQLELAEREQNLPATRKLFGPWSYFIDTTYAVGPRECHDPDHPVGRNEDIAWKIKLSDYARDVFGLFGSECGREWALPHSDFFEGLVGVSGRYFHNLDPADIGATVIPFWEMVYHDCQIAYGKYGYAADQAAEYVAHHVLCSRPLHYHSIPDGLYWKAPPGRSASVEARVRVGVEAVGEGAFRIRYAWDVEEDVGADWRIFVHFGTPGKILFQDDHLPQPPTSEWRKGRTIEIGPRTVEVPASVRREAVNVYIGLYSPEEAGQRARLPGCDGQRRVLAGVLNLRPRASIKPATDEPAAVGPAADEPGPDRSCYSRSDGGWTQGMHPTDVFLKNTHEVLGPLHAATAHDRLTKLELLTPDGAVRRATYGNATRVTVNFGREDAEVTSKLGGRTVLPPWGFVVEGRRFAAFCARRWGGQDYPGGALFTLQALDDRRLEESGRVRVFHGFGAATIRWKGESHLVPRERVIEPGAGAAAPRLP